MKKPKPHGINSDFAFSKKEIDQLKLYRSLTDVSVSDWNSFSTLISRDLKNNKKQTAIKSWQKFRNAFLLISDTYIKQPAITRYTKLLVEYMDIEENKAEYLNVYDRLSSASEDVEINRQLEENQSKVRKKIKLIETVKLNKELDDEIYTITPSTSNAADKSSPVLSRESSPSSIYQPSSINNTNDISNINDSNSTNYSSPAVVSIPLKSILYNDAKQLHDSYKKGKNLTPAEKKRMCAGLSGILDIVDQEMNGQRKLFTPEEWETVCSYYSSIVTMSINNINNNFLDCWDMVLNTCNENNSFFPAQQLLSTISGQPDVNETKYNELKLLDLILDIMNNKQYILNPIHPDNLTEGDYTYQIWLPVLTKLFNINNNFIRLKPSESVLDESTLKKARQYGDNAHVIGFKIDIRFIYDHKEYEFDIANAEVALPTADDIKIKYDEGKLLREGMINTEGMHHLLKDRINNIYTWIIEITGLTAFFSIVLYDEVELYIAIPQFEIHFPTCVGDLEDVKDDIKKLLLLRNDIERIGREVEKKIKENQRKATHRSHREASPERKPAPSLSTYFTPPRKDVFYSIIPPKNDNILTKAFNVKFPSLNSPHYDH